MPAKSSPRRQPLEAVELDLHPNEASDLAPIHNSGVLAAHGWDLGFWSVLDETPAESSVVAIGRRAVEADEGGAQAHDTARDESSRTWEVVHPRFELDGGAGKTEDAEACTINEGWVYVVGSHFGGKTGPLEKGRQWVARFREDAFEGSLLDTKPHLDLARNGFRLHRAVNDGLRAFGPDLLEPGPEVRKRFIKQGRKKGGKKAKARIGKGDHPINVEGAAFLPDGSLLLGLRFPITADGHPLLVELAGEESLFANEPVAPVVRRFWVLANVGSKRNPAGIRALHRSGSVMHAVTGNLDDPSKDSAVLSDHPEGARARSAHYRFRAPRARDGGAVEAELVRRFEAENVEGLAPGAGGFHYVTDEDEAVRLRSPRGDGR